MTNMVLIFKQRTDAEIAIQEANDVEGLVKNGTYNLFTIQDHPDSEVSRVAVNVPEIFQNRSWYSDFKSKADEVVEELTDDWFEE